MAGFILFDTQAIMEKRRMGNQDYIGHSLDLFFDFITMFRKLLIILTQKVRPTTINISVEADSKIEGFFLFFFILGTTRTRKKTQKLKITEK
jgi:hypothetical protein